ncbi:MAG: hypothetical protein NC338_08945 [Firmicutes bacterium]|nr:hypothetical protein [Bacillota bacterium]MCM1402091.1 hypothetical protein [Bacteroides sp.]MCM1476550.1 hypothetical protein [Bacteroides sp.]
MEYFIKFRGETIGPMRADQVVAYNVNENTPVSVNYTDWQPLYQYPELMQTLHKKSDERQRSTPPPSPTESYNSYRVACGVLAIVIGGFGLQYFIIGKVAGGFINIALAIATCGAWSVINLIQGIMILCMSDSEFETKYVHSTSVFPLF